MSYPPHRSTFDFGYIMPLVGRVLTRKIFFLLLLLGALLTAARAYTSKPVFRSEAVLIYQDRGGSNPIAQREAPSPRRIAFTLQETLFSRALLQKLISEFGLYADTVSRMGMVPAVEQMQKRDLHFEGREGYTFRISFDSISPDLAQLVAARAADLLIRAHVDGRAQEAQEINRFLESERGRIEKELRSNEAALALFVTQHPEVVEAETTRGSLPVDNSASESASLGMEMQALQLRERLAQLRQQPAAGSQPAGGSSPREASEARTRAETELASAERELAERQTQFTDAHPDVRRAMARVSSAKASLRRIAEGSSAPPNLGHASPEIRPPSTADSPEARMVAEQLDLLQKYARTARTQTRHPRAGGTSDPVAFARLRTQFSELDRRTRESRDHHDLLENRQFQAEMQALFATQGKRGDLTVADPAFKPVVPMRSPRKKISVVGGAGTLLFALAVSLVLVLRDDRLRGPVDFRRFDLPPLLCEIPSPKEPG